MKKSFGSARGQIAVLYAGILFVLVGAIALGTDVAVMYLNWQQVQKVADAAAMAGSNFLTGITFTGTVDPSCTGQPDSATQAACTYAVNNGLAASTLAISEPPGAIKVVATETGLSYYFGKVLGLNSYAVSATASAQASQPPGTSSIFPIGLQCDYPCSSSSLVAGQPVTFGAKFVTSTIDCQPGVGSCPASGNWQWLDVSGGSSGGDSLLASAIDGTAPGATFSIGGTINSEPGNKGQSGPVKKAFNDRMARCPSITDPCGPGGNPTNIPANDPCLVTVPVVNFAGCGSAATTGCNGSKALPIYGFAQVYLEPATSTSTSINGCYVQAIDANSIGSSTAPAFGALSPPVLIQ